VPRAVSRRTPSDDKNGTKGGSYENIDAILSADAKPEVIKEVKAGLSSQIIDLFCPPSVPLGPAAD